MRISPIAIVLIFFACTKPSEQSGVYMPEGMDRREKTRYEQYLVQGKRLYIQHCQNCHQKDGGGLGTLYPPLANSDYLKKNHSDLSCVIKYGLEGEIIVNGESFNMKMEGLRNLKDLEIAEILTYVSNSWGNQHGMISVQEVQGQLKDCVSTD